MATARLRSRRPASVLGPRDPTALGLGGLGGWLALGSVRFRMGGVACAVIWLLPIPLCFVRYLQMPGSSVVLASLGIAGSVLAAVLALLPGWLLQRWRRV